MSTRLSRADTVVRNRDLVLAAAEEVFVDRGFHEASLDQIADRAGFSKGVVYSQFASKADLLLAIVERRIDARAEENAAIADGLRDIRDVGELARTWLEQDRTNVRWSMLLMEFRLHAARHPELSVRYAALHARTVERLARTLVGLYSRAKVEPPDDPLDLAAALLGLGAGAALERLADPVRLGDGTSVRIATRVLAALERGAT